MDKKIRLDKYLADMGVGTRSEVKGYIRKGRIKCNQEVVKSPETKVDVTGDEITFDGNLVSYVGVEYYMLHKPAGVVSATRDKFTEAVVDLIDSPNKDLFPVGRLDKDTEGLLIITNDGDLGHKLLSPKNKIPKVYYARINGPLEDKHIELFEQGVDLGDFIAMPAKLTIIESGEESEVYVTVYEGKFHQVKRMFETIDREVVYLKRMSMGSLQLDESLKAGEYRPLTEEELALLRKE